LLIPFRLRPALLVMDDGLTLDRPAVVRIAEDAPVLFRTLGDMLTDIAIPDSPLEPLREDEILCARLLAAQCGRRLAGLSGPAFSGRVQLR
jgi:hypothetical protein